MPTGNPNEKNEVQALSSHVSYCFQKKGNRRTAEGLFASGRFYPGILTNHTFYSGIHHKNRFVPGFVGNGRFIPGLVTKRGFYPGLATSNGFMPGIIAMGVFMPGIVHGRNFVPGLSDAHGFLPGSFTTGGRFIPGRFVNGHFENGIADERRFIPGGYDYLTVSEARDMISKGRGLTDLKHGEQVGGLPIKGTVVGRLGNMLSVVPYGLVTDEGVILGGLWDEDYIPTVDPDAPLGHLGLKGDDLGDLLGTENPFGDMIGELSDGLNNPLGTGQGGPSLEEALGALGQGENELIDKMNEDMAEYWADVFGQNVGGMVSGSGGSGSQPWNWNQFWASVGAGARTGAGAGAVSGFISGGPVGAVAGAAVGAVGGAVAGAAGYAVDYAVDVVEDIADKVVEVGKNILGAIVGWFGSPDEDGDDGNGFYIQPRRAPLTIPITRKTLISFDQGDSNNSNSTITIERTDTGAMVVIRFSELAFAARGSADNRVNLGMNPLTGNSTLVAVLPPDEKAVVGKAIHKMYRDYVVHPLGG